MLRIRQVADTTSPRNVTAIRHVQEIMLHQVSKTTAEYVASVPEMLADPLKFRFSAVLLVAEDAHDQAKGFALILHAPDLRFSFLEMIATAPGMTTGGIGGALYAQVRSEALARRDQGLFFECLTDNPAYAATPEALKQNINRLRFYERFGAYPIVNTAYEEPLDESDTAPLFLMYDRLGSATPLRRRPAREIVRAILERKYSHLIPPAQIEATVQSFRDDPVALRVPRYTTPTQAPGARAPDTRLAAVALVVSEKHAIHHVRDQAYVESPVRIRSILPELKRTDLFRQIEPKRYAESHIRAVHDGAFVDYLRRASARVGPGASIYPQVFPVRNRARPPRELPLRAGYFCIDTFTPLNENAYRAARYAVDCTLTAAEQVRDGQRLAYALVRPPGHHAERRAFGGFCYFNNAAIAAHFLSRYGKVAVLDIDYHHGNGTQEIFYARADVLTISIHGEPRAAYPYFSGFADETGEGAGAGYNVNLPLPERIEPARYHAALERALRIVRRFRPSYLVVALGLDTAKADPTATWPLRARDFDRIGETIGAAGYLTLVVQEGGYRTHTLGTNARNFFVGLSRGSRAAPPGKAYGILRPPS